MILHTAIFKIRMVLLILLISHLKHIKYNIRHSNKNLESLKDVFFKLNFCFQTIGITESWFSDDLLSNNRYQLPSYVSVHQIRKKGKTGDGIPIFIHREIFIIEVMILVLIMMTLKHFALK